MLEKLEMEKKVVTKKPVVSTNQSKNSQLKLLAGAVKRKSENARFILQRGLLPQKIHLSQKMNRANNRIKVWCSRYYRRENFCLNKLPEDNVPSVSFRANRPVMEFCLIMFNLKIFPTTAHTDHDIFVCSCNLP